MAIRFFNPYTPGNRNRSGSDFSELTRKAPEKHLVKGQKRSHGRNNRGVITCRHKGGGHKRLYRQIDFRRGRFAPSEEQEKTRQDAAYREDDEKRPFAKSPVNHQNHNDIGDQCPDEKCRSVLALRREMLLLMLRWKNPWPQALRPRMQ